MIVSIRRWIRPSAPAPLRPTAWIDGVKGLAMVAVFNYHFVFAWTVAPEYGWGLGGSYGHLFIHLFRIAFNGLSMVYLFFLLGGYTISISPLRSMAKGASSDADLLRQLSSSLFRRSMRLLLPVFAVNFLIMILVLLGVYAWGVSQFGHYAGFRPEPHFEKPATFREHWNYYLFDIGCHSNVWEWGVGHVNQHDPHQWFIEYQLRASLACYLCLLMVACAKARARYVLLLLSSAYCHWWGRYEVTLFLWGACLSNWNLSQSSHRGEIKNIVQLPASSQVASLQQPSDAQQSIRPRVTLETDEEKIPLTSTSFVSECESPFDPFDVEMGSQFASVSASSALTAAATTTPPQRQTEGPRRILDALIWGCELLAAVWFLSSPRVGFHDSYGYKWLYAWIPSWYAQKQTWWPSIGAALLVHCLSRATETSWPSKVLCSRFAQFLGRYSFSVYLIHGPVLYTMGFPLLGFVWHLLGGQEGHRWLAGMLIAWTFSFSMSLFIGVRFFYFVEEPCGHLSKKIEKLCFR